MTKFLITNDDGVEAPGLAALHRVLQEFGECRVLAPHEHLSGCSHRATTHRPLTISAIREGWQMLDGSPVDCVRVGLRHLGGDFDWVVSGINDGANLGHDIYLSGTVAAAREACLLGTPAIAVSQYRRGATIDWQRSVEWTRGVILKLLGQAPLPGSFWNVNLPHAAMDAAPPLSEICPVDRRALPVDYEVREGRLHYRGNYHDRPRGAGSDVAVCFAGRIAISLITLV